jgi:hypothetical protein
MQSAVESSAPIAPSSLVSWSGAGANARDPDRWMPMGAGLAGLLARLQWWWRGLPERARLLCLTGLATAGIAALLFAFVSEVNEAGRQGGMRREATAALAAMTWRCNAVSDVGARQDCLSNLPLAPNRGALRAVGSAPGLAQTSVALDASKTR